MRANGVYESNSCISIPVVLHPILPSNERDFIPQNAFRGTAAGMITLLGNPKRGCHGITRREALTAGGVSLFGLTLPDLLRAEAVQPKLPSGRAKSVILVYLFGGPPLHDTFDPKHLCGDGH